MPIYMIRAGRKGLVKIGYSEDIVARMVKMQADNHERLILLRKFEGGKAEEALLHQRFADSSQHGEWFSFTKAMLGDVGLAEIKPSVTELLENCFDIWTEIRRQEAAA